MKLFNTIFLLLALFQISIPQSKNQDDENILTSFPKNFLEGTLSTGVDCENIKFLKNGEFIYKFTGDCKGWGRKLKGKWKKKNDHLELSAIMNENYEEAEIGCAGSYYHTNTKAEKDECIKKYKNNIKDKFGIFPVKLKLSGKVWVTNSLDVGVSIETYLISTKKEKVKGLMFFSDEKFGTFTNDEF
ncbi:MAG: hypothetical protein KDK36_18280 [Leptospiraceae bacterium]|nr:hypothetical protein [Leptospiraceae bacterium]